MLRAVPEIMRTASKTLVVPAKVQDFTYDLDGNLLSDGLWDYSWDAENRLVEMKSTQSAVSGGHPNRTLSFVYDYLGRRCWWSTIYRRFRWI